MGARPILIVEDDDTIAGLIAFVFRHEGFAPLVLRDGMAAEKHIQAHQPPAAAVLDVMLPYRDGYAVAAAIRSDERWKHVPIVMLSAKSAGLDAERGHGLAVDAYMTKPFQPQALVRAVKDLLGPSA